MTVFATLKWPNPDIFNREELLALPEPIILEWWKRIYAGLDPAIKVEYHPTTSEEVYTTLCESWLYPCAGDINSEGSIAEFTNCLKACIRDYDEPL